MLQQYNALLLCTPFDLFLGLRNYSFQLKILCCLHEARDDMRADVDVDVGSGCNEYTPLTLRTSLLHKSP